ncbi:MAG: hypothetical protein E2P02_00540 [Acidobacteria bacterium]|nr:MAG: hypothetical protein E2P02_00540 [Acidobacteriota bacterium]
MPFSPQTRLAQKHDAVALLRGFGNFELLWVLLVTFLFTVAFRIGGWVFGSEVGWGFYDSEQTALREAKANIDWLR